ncbi:MAG TPA: transketolase [Pirellulales bacterium]|jgi:transketolase|nr:transketolase [Pirellulales bacterium]
MSVSSEVSIEQLTINTIRTLSMDAVQAAKSGHPGTPMALAPVAYTLWRNLMRFDPDAPLWPARDRFVLSCGHASMLLYSVLHLAGVKQYTHDAKPTGELACSLDQIKRFRQLHSRCPGHPESFETTGVETTTGPLGQGCGNSVGMAIAQRWLAAHFDRPGFKLFDYNVYTMCSDGDMMEGVSNEAASLAGHLKLSNLCWIYDDNHITIEGNTQLAFDEDVGHRFEGLGWHVLHVADANDLDALAAAFQSFEKTDDRPTMIIVRSHIGYGSPNKQDTAKAHGEALGEEEVRLTKKVYGWPEDAHFLVPEEAREHFQAGVAVRGKKLHAEWEASWKRYATQYPDLAKEWELMNVRDLPAGWDADLKPQPADAKGVASRISSGKAEGAVAKHVPWLIGGAADLAPSTMTLLTGEGYTDFETGNYSGRNFHFGIREHAMVAAANGMAFAKVRPFVATFFVFFDYCKPSLRLAAIGKLPVIFIFTHDSIGLGEDGPTHQPIEHLAAMRAIPNILVFRPADANEVVETWRVVMPLKDRPAALVLTRQNLPTVDRSKFGAASGVAKGAYVLADPPHGKPAVILMATGSEVGPCVEAYEQLTKEGIAARVVSMPCWELFEAQDEAYRNSVLPPAITARVGVEAAAQFGWDRYLGPSGRFVGMKTFGASAPGPALMKFFGLTTENIVATAKAALSGGKK